MSFTELIAWKSANLKKKNEEKPPEEEEKEAPQLEFDPITEESALVDDSFKTD